MDEGQTPGGNPTPDVAVRDEVGKIMAEPGWGKDPALEARVAKLYTDRYGSGKVELSEGLSVGDAVPATANESSADAETRARNDAITARLKTDWGDEAESRFAEAGSTVRTLFAGLDEPFTKLDSTIQREYGPEGVVAAVKFLHELARIKKGG